MLEVGQRREQDRGKRRKEHRQPRSLWLPGAVTNGVQGLQAEPDTEAEARKVQRVPKDLRRGAGWRAAIAANGAKNIAWNGGPMKPSAALLPS